MADLRTTQETILDLVEQIKREREAGVVTTQTASYSSNLGGFATGVCIASCVATIFLMLAFMIIENRSYTHLDAQVDQLRAWSDVHSKEIARLQAQKKE